MYICDWGKSENLTINSSRNSYQYRNLRAPDESVVLMQFSQNERHSPWDNITYLKMYDKKLDGYEHVNLSSWTNLLDGDGRFKKEYEKFTSRSSSVYIIFSSTKTNCSITISMSAIDRTGI